MGRAPCCDKANVKRGPWSPEEDTILKNYLEKHGTGGNWIALPHKAGLKRCGKSCRLRWLNYLRPDIKHGGFSEEEDNIICTLYGAIGSRWSVIASKLPGRTDNDIKNYWNTKLKKKLLAGKVNLSTSKNNNNNDIISNNTSLHLSSTQPFYYGNSTDYVDPSFCILPYVTDMSCQQQNLEPQGIILDPISQVPFTGLTEVSDYSSMSSVQEASSLSISSSLTLESNSVVSWSADGNFEELGISLQDFGFDSSYELLYEFDFQKATNQEVAPGLGNYP